MTPSVEAPPSPGFPRLLAAASLLIPLTFFGTVAWQTYQEQRAAFAEEASWTARLLQEHAQRLMRGYQSALRLVHYQIEQGGLPAADGPDDLQDFLRALAESSDALEAITVADRDGHVLVADVPLSSPQSSIARVFSASCRKHRTHYRRHYHHTAVPNRGFYCRTSGSPVHWKF